MAFAAAVLAFGAQGAWAVEGDIIFERAELPQGEAPAAAEEAEEEAAEEPEAEAAEEAGEEEAEEPEEAPAEEAEEAPAEEAEEEPAEEAEEEPAEGAEVEPGEAGAAVSAAPEKKPGGDSLSEEETKYYPPALFPHWVHIIRYRCFVCHPRLYRMEIAPPLPSGREHHEKTSCGRCHNGANGFEISFATCGRCHVAQEEE